MASSDAFLHRQVIGAWERATQLRIELGPTSPRKSAAAHTPLAEAETTIYVASLDALAL